jgi:lipoprotein-anchoring transpeptidase ErfK/SrfK
MRLLVALGLTAVMTASTAALAQTKTPKPPAPPPKALPAPAPAPAASPADLAAPVVAPELAVQIMLDRIGYSPGEIDGKPGINLRRAVETFQRTHDLPATGRIDDATVQRLTERAGTQPPLVSYEIAEADVAGPFVADIPADLTEQAKLPALGYRTPLEGLAEKFHASPALLKAMNPNATFASGERIQVPNIAAADPLAPAPGTRVAAKIVVSKATSTLTVRDDHDQVLFQAPVTTGSQHDPLPIGTWKVTGVQQAPEFHYNPALFWDADPSHSKAVIPPGPNNPVGRVWIGLSKEHYGIHGTPEPSRIGHVTSHGCVRLTNWDAERVATWARPGTTVIFE